MILEVETELEVVAEAADGDQAVLSPRTLIPTSC